MALVSQLKDLPDLSKSESAKNRKFSLDPFRCNIYIYRLVLFSIKKKKRNEIITPTKREEKKSRKKGKKTGTQTSRRKRLRQQNGAS